MRYLTLLLLVACAPAPEPAPGDDPYAITCAHLAAIGCEDGSHPRCADTMKRMVDGHLTKIDVACLQRAADTTTAKACGGVRCR